MIALVARVLEHAGVVRPSRQVQRGGPGRAEGVRSPRMKVRVTVTIAASALALAASAHVLAQSRAAGTPAGDRGWTARTLWGDPDLQGEWTSEGEYGVPFERPAQFGTRQFLSDEEYARRLDDIKRRDERDLAPVDVLSGRVEGPSAPIPH